LDFQSTFPAFLGKRKQNNARKSTHRPQERLRSPYKMNPGIGNERPINHAQWKKRKGNNRSTMIKSQATKTKITQKKKA
jgi:hypothetical protein